MLSWNTDPQFAAFMERYRELNRGYYADGDYQKAYDFVWRSLSTEERLARMAALKTHTPEFRANFEYMPTPRNYLETNWERSAKPQSRTAEVSAKKVPTWDEFQKLVELHSAKRA